MTQPMSARTVTHTMFLFSVCACARCLCGCCAARQFNQVGFYSELLSELDHTHAALIEVNTRSQQFLYGVRIKTPPIEPATRAYVPYYPSQHLASKGRAFVARQPLADARQVAASVAAPVIVVRDQTEEKQQSPPAAASSASFSWQQRSVANVNRPPSPTAPSPAAAASSSFSSSSAVPVHLRNTGENVTVERPPSPSAAATATEATPAAADSDQSTFDAGSVSAAVASARARLAQERARFAEEMRQQLTARMTIVAPSAQQTGDAQTAFES